MNKYEYPYKSEVAQWKRMTTKHRRDEYGDYYPEVGYEYVEPGFSVENELNTRVGQFLELGGPTDFGYYHLDGVQMNRRIIVSNVGDEKIRSYNPDYADDLIGRTDMDIDGTNIDLPDGSLGAVFASHIPYLHNPDSFNDDEALRMAKAIPKQAMEQGFISEDHFDLSLRLDIADEVYRKLEPGGLYFTDGITRDVHALVLMGYELKALVDRDKFDSYHHIVLQKPIAESAVNEVA